MHVRMKDHEMKDDEQPDASVALLDCSQGLRLGCSAFCCRLIVRLGPRDPPSYDAQGRRKSCVDKDPQTGLCVHFDPDTQRCKVWDRRPWVCRTYDCNHDPLLQVVLRDGFVSLRRLITAKATNPGKVAIPKTEA
jgi:uncharacterized protein